MGIKKAREFIRKPVTPANGEQRILAAARTPQARRRRALGLLLGFLVLLTMLPLLLLMNALSGSQSENAGSGGQSLGGAYYTYRGRIYMNIGGQGYYLVPQADAASFKSLSYGNIALGKDQHAVYCGSRVIPGLDPLRIAFVSPGYISDGDNAWYCSADDKPNPDYHWWQLFTRGNDEDDLDKAREHDYQLTQLDHVEAGKLKTIASQYAYDGKTIFFEGQAIAGSDAASVQTIKLGFGDLKGRNSDYYLRDRDRVYYKGVPLAGAHPDHFTELRPNSDQWQTAYGFDSATGKYYFEAKAFPDAVDGKNAQSLTLLMADRDRAYHELFYNSSGIWYWNYQGTGLEYACANPFDLSTMPDGKPIELAPGIWADKNNTVITQAVQLWRTGGSGRGSSGDHSLSDSNTELLMMRGVAFGDWEKVEDIKRAGGTRGTLWRVRNTYYYTPSSVINELFKASIYQVTNVQKLKDGIARGNPDRPDLPRGRDTVLAPIPQARLVCRANSHFPSEAEFWK